MAAPRPVGRPAAISGVGIPAYIEPVSGRSHWECLAGASGKGLALVVANVADGPGPATSSAWAEVLESCRAGGTRVLGYVNTGYLGASGQLNPAGSSARERWCEAVERDVESWFGLYDGLIDGVFLDQCALVGSDEHTSSLLWSGYDRLARFVRDRFPGALVAFNAGTAVPDSVEDLADLVVSFEGSYASYRERRSGEASSGFVPLDWTPSSSTTIWHLVYSARSAEEMADAVALGRARGASLMYVTDREPANPWDALPPQRYFAEQLVAVAATPIRRSRHG